MTDYTRINFQVGPGGGTPCDLTNMNKLEEAVETVHEEIALLVPPGLCVYYPKTTIPSGWLECNGQSVLRSTYSALFAVIGETYGHVDDTHFNVPDYRGYFLRGLDESTGRDAWAAEHSNTQRTITDAQTDSIKPHLHPFNYMPSTGEEEAGGNPHYRWPARNATNTTGNPAGEGRSKNVALVVMIKT